MQSCLSKNPKLKSSLTFAYKWLFLSQELWVVLFVDVHVIVGEHCLTFQVFFSISIQKDANNQGTCKVRNEIKTKRNRTKRNRTERNETKRNRVKCSIYFDQRKKNVVWRLRGFNCRKCKTKIKKSFTKILTIILSVKIVLTLGVKLLCRHFLSRVVVPATLHTPLSTLILQDFCKI